MKAASISKNSGLIVDTAEARSWKNTNMYRNRWSLGLLRSKSLRTTSMSVRLAMEATKVVPCVR